ncbi:hypothetical protein FRX31_004503 [Thalictrum thalictroides]|uniref:Uncharacterized protein n=1 Tax=Thalictrum thalictroides TaxID=46969 RepID=A0A7J6X802_THATH|nr:hypothetical protein FRX31_004503 [Thalictrum thalictroides]
MAITDFEVGEIMMRGNAQSLLFELLWVLQIIIDPNDMLVEKYTSDIFSSLIMCCTVSSVFLLLSIISLKALKFGIARRLALQKGFQIFCIVAHAIGHAFMVVTFVIGLEVIAESSSAWDHS